MPKPFERRLRINNFIRAPQVNVIGPAGEKLGAMALHEALKIAEQHSMDVVEVGPTSTPPLVKILDYGKYQYQQERRNKGGGKAPGQEVKTVQIGFRTEAHDMQVRAAQADKFLQKGHRVKLELKLRGREKGMVPLGREKLKKFMQILAEPFEPEGVISSFPGGVGMLVKPIKK